MVEWREREKAMKTARRTELGLFEDLEAAPPTFGVAILNKERFLEILKESNGITNLSLLKNIKSEFLTYRGAIL